MEWGSWTQGDLVRQRAMEWPSGDAISLSWQLARAQIRDLEGPCQDAGLHPFRPVGSEMHYMGYGGGSLGFTLEN